MGAIYIRTLEAVGCVQLVQGIADFSFSSQHPLRQGKIQGPCRGGYSFPPDTSPIVHPEQRPWERAPILRWGRWHVYGEYIGGPRITTIPVPCNYLDMEFKWGSWQTLLATSVHTLVRLAQSMSVTIDTPGRLSVGPMDNLQAKYGEHRIDRWPCRFQPEAKHQECVG